MKLTDIQFARTAAFVLGLRVIADAKPLTPEQITGSAPIPNLNENTIAALQRLTVERSNVLAMELGVSFPDETERETEVSEQYPTHPETPEEREPTEDELAAMAKEDMRADALDFV